MTTGTEQQIAEFLRKLAELGHAEEFLREHLGLLSSYLFSPTPGQDVVADRQQKARVERLLQFEEVVPTIQPHIEKIFNQCRAISNADSGSTGELLVLLEPLLEILMEIPAASRWILLARELSATHEGAEGAHGLVFYKMMCDLERLKVAELITKMLTLEGARNVVDLGVLASLLDENAMDTSGGKGDNNSVQVLGALRTTVKNDETIKFRFLQLVIELAKAGFVVPGGFKAISNAFFTDDILVKLNALELFQQLGSSEVGISEVNWFSITGFQLNGMINCKSIIFNFIQQKYPIRS